MRTSNIGTLFLTLLAVACVREPASTLFQPTVEAAYQVARQRHGGDIIVFVSDESSVCRNVRRQIIGSPPVAQFIAANFAAVEVPVGSDAARNVLARYRGQDRPQIIIASERLNNLHIHVLRLERLKAERFLEQLRGVKQAKTIDEYRRTLPKRPHTSK